MNVEELKKQLESGELVGEDLSDTVLDGVDFTSCKLRRVSFKGASLSRCRFRKADIAWCDFRYAHIEAGTFEDAKVDFCDFYRALFEGIVIFNHSIFSNCSFTKCYFGDSAVIRKGNLKDGRVLQQDKEAYRKFLCDWHDFGTGERQNDLNLRSDWSPEAALKGRWLEAEELFKNFNALWTGKGFIADGNWAYVRGRRMERRRMLSDYANPKVSVTEKAVNTWKIITNYFSDIFFGFGESMFRMVMTYVVTVFIFAWAFTSNVSILEYGQALGVSLKNMAGMDSDILRDVSPLVDMLNVTQTTIGIILTGIFGFILGNKIRNQ